MARAGCTHVYADGTQRDNGGDGDGCIQTKRARKSAEARVRSAGGAVGRNPASRRSGESGIDRQNRVAAEGHGEGREYGQVYWVTGSMRKPTESDVVRERKRGRAVAAEARPVRASSRTLFPESSPLDIHLLVE